MKKPLHVVEMDISRGIGIWLDGKCANYGWSVGEVGGTEIGDIEGGGLSCEGLTINGHKITRVSDPSQHGGMPPRGLSVTMVIDGKLLKGKLVSRRIGDPDKGPARLKLHNGEKYEVGECNFYVKMHFYA